MPIYFFHTDGGARVVDDVGIDLPNDAKAHQEAIRLAGAMMNQEPQLLWGGRRFLTEVVSEAGKPLFTIIAQAVPGAVPEKM